MLHLGESLGDTRGLGTQEVHGYEWSGDLRDSGTRRLDTGEGSWGWPLSSHGVCKREGPGRAGTRPPRLQVHWWCELEGLWGGGGGRIPRSMCASCCTVCGRDTACQAGAAAEQLDPPESQALGAWSGPHAILLVSPASGPSTSTWHGSWLAVRFPAGQRQELRDTPAHAHTANPLLGRGGKRGAVCRSRSRPRSRCRPAPVLRLRACTGVERAALSTGSQPPAVARLGNGEESVVRDRTVTSGEPGGGCSASCHGHRVMGRATIKRWGPCLMRLLSQEGPRTRGVGRTGSRGQRRAVPELSAATPGSPQAGPPLAQGRALGALQPAAPSASAQQLPVLPRCSGLPGPRPQAALPPVVLAA